MVKAVVGEETQLKRVEDRLSQSSILSQVGLVIGKLSPSLDRGFVFDLVPTPPNDAGEPACSLLDPIRDDRKKGPKGKSQGGSDSSSLSVDKDWVAEHARQVSRMLVGGIKVVGVYIWVSDIAFKNSTMEICQTVKAVAEAAPTEYNERLLIHICYSPRRWTCKNFSPSSNITSSSLRPCDFKMGKVLNSLQRFRSTYNFDIRLPVSQEIALNVRTLSNVLRRGISVIAKELKGAKALVDGNLVVADEPCTSDVFHDIELLLPFMKDACTEACVLENIVGVLKFSGSVSSFAFLTSKELISQAIADIKGDIIMSLQSRLDIICDEADADTDENESIDGVLPDKLISQADLQLLRKPSTLSFPQRVFAPWLAGTYICDYLQPSETLQVLKDHCAELLSVEVQTDAFKILEPELEVSSEIAKSFWEAVTPSNSTSKSLVKELSSNSTRSSSFSIIAAVIVLLLSILVGFLFLAAF
ncbi:protein odr-4 homolog [Punica granatum]|uniref:Protein odr-4 homolog n=1 Tax=Punica granatum TaxID=22663 RepID=A0A6P8C3S3_PUNGR|nr:protein odr-4 homolog [Punica granatum]